MISSKALAVAIEPYARNDDLSGAILVAQGGDVLFERAYGFASRQLNVPNTLETKFHIASVTKTFIAMAALILREQQLIDLHERPAVYVPELAELDREITLHHLLSHTSGLHDIYDVKHLRFEMDKLNLEHGDVLSYLAQQPQLFRPGRGWAYSSTGFMFAPNATRRISVLASPARHGCC